MLCNASSGYPLRSMTSSQWIHPIMCRIHFTRIFKVLSLVPIVSSYSEISFSPSRFQSYPVCPYPILFASNLSKHYLKAISSFMNSSRTHFYHCGSSNCNFLLYLWSFCVSKNENWVESITFLSSQNMWFLTQSPLQFCSFNHSYRYILPLHAVSWAFSVMLCM